MSNLVYIRNDELLVSSWDLSLGFGVEHRAILKLLRKYQNEFETFGIFPPGMQQSRKKKVGHPIKEQFLNEAQAMYLTTLLTNNETVRKFKMHLTREFIEQRKLLMKMMNNKSNQEWLETRAKGIYARKETTDVIKMFVEYAKEQGSKNAEQYYVNITSMENAKLMPLEFLEQKYPNLRQVVDQYTLNKLMMCDEIIAQALVEGMQKELYYKEIYRFAKDRVMTYAELVNGNVRKKLEDTKMELKALIAKKREERLDQATFL